MSADFMTGFAKLKPESMGNYSGYAVGRNDFEIDEEALKHWRAQDLCNWQPMNDGVLIERLEPMIKVRGGIYLTDDTNGNGPLLRKGKVLACGPGKWVEGTWWCFWDLEWQTDDGGMKAWRARWEWLDSYREPLDVKPGMTVLFNARWNDFAHGELRGTGSDKSGPLERPLPVGYDEKIHLVQEADIAGIIS